MLPDTPWKCLCEEKIDQGERYQILEKNTYPQAKKTQYAWAYCNTPMPANWQVTKGETIRRLVQKRDCRASLAMTNSRNDAPMGSLRGA
jgi:hypothetical protein